MEQINKKKLKKIKNLGFQAMACICKQRHAYAGRIPHIQDLICICMLMVHTRKVVQNPNPEKQSRNKNPNSSNQHAQNKQENINLL